jgi:hypothetical protein
VSLFVDTSVWSLAFRRTDESGAPQVKALVYALEMGDSLVTAGVVIQELLQGFSGPKFRSLLIETLANIPILTPMRDSYIEAAELRNHCRRNGVQAATIDALIAQLCIENDLTLLTVDQDFSHMARFTPLRIWRA